MTSTPQASAAAAPVAARVAPWRLALAALMGAAAAALGAWVQMAEEAGAHHPDASLAHALSHQVMLGLVVAVLAGVALGGRTTRGFALAALVAAVAWLAAIVAWSLIP